MKDGGYGRGGDHTSGTGGTSSKSGGSDSKGSNYTFSSYKSAPNTSGNWNTGGTVTGHGSFSRGIEKSPIAMPRAVPRPTGWNAPPQVVPPMPVTPITSPITPPPATYEPVDVWGPTYRMDPNIINSMFGGQRIQSTFPGRPGVSPSIGVSNKDQSRLPGMGGNGPAGRSGGGFGGGGGGGW